MALAVSAEAMLLVLSAALLIAQVRAGCFLLAFAVLVQALTVDNPACQTTQVMHDIAVENLLKDLAIISACLLLGARRRKVVHRR